MRCFFATDIHGYTDRYRKLFAAIAAERPDAVFLGGDLLPGLHGLAAPSEDQPDDYVDGFLAARFERLKSELGPDGPRVFIILGNDDLRVEEPAFLATSERGVWEYVHGRGVSIGDLTVFGYACVPPTPFLHKDWERYDVSRFVDPGSVSPEEGRRSVPVDPHEVRYGTILEDLESLTGDADLSRAIFLFHSPPYETKLDRAALDDRKVDHVPVDVHVGSIAIRRFIESRQPLVTLHGHVHESTRLTGEWRDVLGSTHMFGAAHDGPELALVRFDTDALEEATRELL